MFNNNKGEYRFPFDIQWVDEETNKDLLRHFTGKNEHIASEFLTRFRLFAGERTGFVQVGGEEKWFFPSKYMKQAEHYYNFASRPDDIWVATFPRSGTTWTQELVWMIANDLDYEGSQSRPLTERFPFFE